MFRPRDVCADRAKLVHNVACFDNNHGRKEIAPVEAKEAMNVRASPGLGKPRDDLQYNYICVMSRSTRRRTEGF